LTGRRAPLKVLVIDDEEVSRYLLRQLFASPHNRVIEASGGTEGLRFAFEEQPQLIVLDLLMPEPGGFEVLERLRSEPKTSNIPVVMSTSKPLDAQERARLEHLEAAYLPKELLTSGTASMELRRICIDMGLGDLFPELASPEALKI